MSEDFYPIPLGLTVCVGAACEYCAWRIVGGPATDPVAAGIALAYHAEAAHPKRRRYAREVLAASFLLKANLTRN